MKFSHYLTLAALSLSAVSVATYAQTTQTFRFGEGQTTMQPPKTALAQPQAPEANAEKKHKHQRHYRHHVNGQDTYSHG